MSDQATLEWWSDEKEWAEMALAVSEWLTGLDTPTRPLTTWEREFKESIERQFASNRRLSVKQTDTLKKIYEEKA